MTLCQQTLQNTDFSFMNATDVLTLSSAIIHPKLKVRPLPASHQ